MAWCCSVRECVDIIGHLYQNTGFLQILICLNDGETMVIAKSRTRNDQ